MARIGSILTHLAEFEAVLGRPVDSVRQYLTSETPPHANWTTTATLAASGYEVCVSFTEARTNASYDAIAGGSIDARLGLIGDHLDSIPNAGIVIFNHEMENDGAVNPAKWRAAVAHVLGILKARAPAWQTCICYIGGFSGTQWQIATPLDWWVTEADLVGVDYYNWRGASTPTNLFAQNDNVRDVNDLEILGGAMNSWLEFCAVVNRPLILPEFGSSITQPGNPLGLTNIGAAGRTTWLQQFSDRWRNDPRLRSVMYFNLDSTDSRVNWRLSGGALAAEPASVSAFASLAIPLDTSPPASPSRSGNRVGMIRGPGRQVASMKVRGRRGTSVLRGAGMRAPANILPIGEIHSHLPSLRQSAAGLTGAAVSGGVVQTLPHFTQALAGIAEMAGPIVATLPHFTQSATARAANDGPIVATLPSLRQAAAGLTGSGVSGGVVQTLPHFTQASTAVSEYGAVAASVLPHLTQAATAKRSDHAVVTQTLPHLTQAAAAREASGGPVAQILPALMQSAIGGPPTTRVGSIASVLPHLTQSAHGIGRFDADPLYEPFVQPEAADNDPYAEVLV